MRKKYIFTGFGLLIVILAIAIIFNIDQNAGQGSKENETIQISGGEEGTAWSITNSKVLRIAENGMTVGGNLGELIQIECEPEVSDLTIKDLETEGEFSILAYGEIKINCIGESKVSVILGFDTVTIDGSENKTSCIQLTQLSGESVNIESASLDGEFIFADKNINITGKSKIRLKKRSKSKPSFLHARLQSWHTIQVDLDRGGSVNISGTESILPILAEQEMVLGEDNLVIVPQNGIIRGEDTPYGSNSYFVFDSQEGLATDVVIRNMRIMDGEAE